MADPADWDKIEEGDDLEISEVRQAVEQGARLRVVNRSQDESYETEHALSQRQIEMVLGGSLINLVRNED